MSETTDAIVRASLETLADETRDIGEWFFNFLWDHTGDDSAFVNILEGRRDSWPHHALHDEELDRMEMFRNLVANLTILLGTEEAAAHWLFETKAFANVYGGVPFDFLADGSFDALYLLDTLVHAEVKENSREASRRHYLFKESVSHYREVRG